VLLLERRPFACHTLDQISQPSGLVAIFDQWQDVDLHGHRRFGR
jgi:hypothetical protein